MHLLIWVVLVAVVSIQVSEEAIPRKSGKELQHLEAVNRAAPIMYKRGDEGERDLEAARYQRGLRGRANEPVSFGGYKRGVPIMYKRGDEGERDLEAARYQRGLRGRANEPVSFGGYKRGVPIMYKRGDEGERDLEAARYQRGLRGRANEPVSFEGYKRVRNHSESIQTTSGQLVIQ